MTIVSLQKAERQLAELVARAESGEEIVISRGDQPIAKLVPIDRHPKTVSGYGRFSHLRSRLPQDAFLEPLGPQDLEEWQSSDLFIADDRR